MKPKKGDPPYIYLHLYLKFKEKATGRPFVQPSFLLKILRGVFRIPKSLQYPILYQMEEYNLIKRINHQKYQILDSKYNKILSDMEEFFLW